MYSENPPDQLIPQTAQQQTQPRSSRTISKHLLILLLALFLSFTIGVQSLNAAKVGYAFSGGGARGFAQLGILKVLEEQGVYPDYISGVSMGAIVGGLYAMGYSASEIEALLGDFDFQDLLSDRYGRQDLYIGQKRWPSYGSISLNIDERWKPNLPSGFFEGNRLNLEIARLFMPASGLRDFSLLPINFTSLSTDLVTGKSVVFTEGSLMQSVRASISIPSVMTPFEFNDCIYVDGGLLQNMPIPQVKAMGADTVVGLKVNSKLRTPERLSNMVEILDQTVNIGMTQNINEHLSDCSLLMEPNLEDNTSISYSSVQEILALGEEYARENIDRIIAFRDSLLALGHVFNRPQKLKSVSSYKIVKIVSRGNEHVSSTKIREYANLEAGFNYTPQEIVAACKEIWNSQSFLIVYPVLEPLSDGYTLVIYVKERERRQLTLNLSYTTEEDLNVGAVLTLNNLVLKNSKLLAGLTLGGRTDFSLDYVKNFGEHWGAYFRLFPYLSEHRLFLYDDDYYKISSVKTLEYGIVPGIGIFANKMANAEAFFYSYRSRLYRDVSSTAPVPTNNVITGTGLKFYHESLDDDVFPRSGVHAFAKFNFARWSATRNQIYSRFVTDLDVYTPLSKFLTVRLGLNYGTYFSADAQSPSDPFYFSGSHGYKGYPNHAVSSPQYRIYTAGASINPANNLYLEAGLQGLNIADSDDWSPAQDVEWCLYGDIGYRTMLGPVRFITAIRKNSRPIYYLNVGYDLDIFWFSRK